MPRLDWRAFAFVLTGDPARAVFAGVVAAALLSCGCSRREGAAEAKSVAPAQDSPGTVTIPAESPKLRQIRVEPVGTAEIPDEEIVSPGKIEVNPRCVSRVVLLVPGRIASVDVRLGDFVRQGQPL